MVVILSLLALLALAAFATAAGLLFGAILGPFVGWAVGIGVFALPTVFVVIIGTRERDFPSGSSKGPTPQSMIKGAADREAHHRIWTDD